ncbi:hypothetical protein [Prevotella sp. HUN102]|uniref:hypothetical protein n=1 Tax=Prevotella sp. HUN102 TaxID=1392486 RepID=UPI00056080C3|nr:hypothetical protein [Prevotella sp. HUN102]
MSKKIMFNDKFCLTQAVLDGTKTMTRRIEKPTKMAAGYTIGDVRRFFCGCTGGNKRFFGLVNKKGDTIGILFPRYQVGEVVAIAQCYLDIGNPQFDKFGHDVPGNTNKMFVKVSLMPHHIRITNVRMECLQDISDENCMREGIKFVGELRADGYNDYYFSCRPTPKHSDNNMIGYFTSPREAYAALIDKVSGKGTFERNPFVVVYQFEKID